MAGQPRAPRQLDVFAIREELVLKRADRFERLDANERRGAARVGEIAGCRKPSRHLRLVETATVAIRIPKTQKVQRIAIAVDDARLSVAKHQTLHDRGARIASGRCNRVVEESRLDLGVGIEQVDELIAVLDGAAESEVV